MRAASWWSCLVSALAVSANVLTPTPTTKGRRWDHGFVKIQNGRFIRNGESFMFLGTNAYWLPSLNSVEDINKTIANISSAGLNAIRTWAFNDVDTVPVNGAWFQLIQNGTTFINNGSNGLQKLDAVVQAAETNGVLLIMSLTNNWNPRPLLDNTTLVPVHTSFGRRDVTVGTNNSLPRNTLSNDFGGMDAYVRAFGKTRQHDEFYLNETIVNVFKNYATQVVSRYKDSPAILAWEVANDPRCNSSVAASNVCNTTTVTAWHADVASHIASIDPNHIVSSGAHGFPCENCTKLFPLAPAPTVSATPTRRWKRIVKPFTNERLLSEAKERRKKTREVKKRKLLDRGDGIRIRGRWIAARQSDPPVGNTVGPAFDGSTGVDSQDILNIPNIGFGSFQLFPDQNDYSVTGSPDPNLPAFNDTVEEGVQWIQIQAQLAQHTRASLKRQNAATGNASAQGVSNAQLVDAYITWINAAITAQLGGALQYQWGQGGLSVNGGSTVSQNDANTTVQANDDVSSISPTDGYQIAPTGSDGIQAVLGNLTSLFG